jgi:hypothetical protein
LDVGVLATPGVPGVDPLHRLSDMIVVAIRILSNGPRVDTLPRGHAPAIAPPESAA